MQDNSNLRSRTVNAIFWNSVDKIGFQGMKFFIGIILARILLPEDYGLIGMISIFLGLGALFTDSGFSSALIQKKYIKEGDYPTVFMINLTVSLIFYVLLFLLSPLIARFYDIPELNQITRVLCISIVIGAFGLVPASILRRNIDFKLQAVISITSVAISGGISIFLATRGVGVWALVFQIVIRDFIRVILLNILVKWKKSLYFSRESFHTMFNFGSKLLIARFLEELFRNIYYIIIGKIYSAKELGFYSKAGGFQELIVLSISDIINIVTFPVFSSIQDNIQRIKSGFKKAVKMISFINFPVLLGLIIVAEPFVDILLTYKWLPCVPYLQLMCLYGLLYPFHAINLNIINALGKSHIFLKLEILKKILIVVTIAICYRWGVMGLIYGQIFASLAAFYMNSYFNKRLVNYSFMEQLTDMFPYLLVSMSMALFIYLMEILIPMSNLLKIIFLPLTGVFIYFTLSYIFKLEALVDILDIIKQKFLKQNK